MNKWIAVFVLSSALLTFADDNASPNPSTAPTVSSPRSKCLSTAAKTLNANLKSCQGKTGNRLAACKQNAYNQNKAARTACTTSRTPTKN